MGVGIRVFLAALFVSVALLIPSVASASPDFMNFVWQKDPRSPVLVGEPPGSWDSLHVVLGTVLRVVNVYHIWYAGTPDNDRWSTGHATSIDGIQWRKDPRNPVLIGGAYPKVLYQAGLYKMWYTNMSHFPWSVDYAVSVDGSSWSAGSDHPVLTVSPSGWDSYTINVGPVVRDKTGYKMWYSATSNGMEWAAGLANSSDGISWTKYTGNPIMSPGFPDPWDSFRVHPTSALVFGGRYVMWYVGSDGSVQRIGTSVSSDGIAWQVPSGPSLDLGPPGSWDDASLSRVSVLGTGGNLTMWYSGNDGSNWRIGIARVPLRS